MKLLINYLSKLLRKLFGKHTAKCGKPVVNCGEQEAHIPETPVNKRKHDNSTGFFILQSLHLPYSILHCLRRKPKKYKFNRNQKRNRIKVHPFWYYQLLQTI